VSPSPEIVFNLVPRMRQGSARAVGFLEGDSELTARIEFDALSDKARMILMARFEYWAAGNNGPDQYFHGWPNDREVKECFTFKLNENRFYGFLVNPQQKTRRAFQVCVLCMFDEKYRQDSCRTILKRVMKWYASEEAGEAIAKVFPDAKDNTLKGSFSKWIH
jgi:hypothetical protein